VSSTRGYSVATTSTTVSWPGRAVNEYAPTTDGL